MISESVTTIRQSDKFTGLVLCVPQGNVLRPVLYQRNTKNTDKHNIATIMDNFVLLVTETKIKLTIGLLIQWFGVCRYTLQHSLH